MGRDVQQVLHRVLVDGDCLDQVRTDPATAVPTSG